MSQALLIEVRHPHSISQANLLAVSQAPQKGTIRKKVQHRRREVYLVQSQLGDLQTL